MTSLRERARYRHLDNALAAMRSAQAELAVALPDPSISFREMSGKSDNAWRAQWRSSREPPDGGWDWPEKRRQYQYGSALKVAMWTNDETELCGLVLGRLNNTACVIDMLEGRPTDHSLKGKVILFAIDIAARYAQVSGRAEVWLNNPANEELIRLYTEAYQFEYVKPKQGSPYCRKAV